MSGGAREFVANVACVRRCRIVRGERFETHSSNTRIFHPINSAWCADEPRAGDDLLTEQAHGLSGR